MASAVLQASRSFGCRLFLASRPGAGCCQSKYVLKTMISSSSMTFRQSCKTFRVKILPNQLRNPPKLRLAKCFSAVRLLTFASPFSYIHRSSAKDKPLSKEVLTSIPTEMLRGDSARAKVKRNFIIEWLLKIWVNFRYMLRFIRLFVTFAPILCTYPLTYLGGWFKRKWWRLVLFACEISGPTFIKLGQWASTRRDLFDPEFCDLFSKLHYCTKVHAWHTTKYKLTKAFGRRWPEIFVSVEKKPVGSGCIAQVHRAWMKANKVADYSILGEIFAEYDEDDLAADIEFAEGLEIEGIAKIMDMTENLLGKFRGTHTKSSSTNAENKSLAQNDGTNATNSPKDGPLQEHTTTELKATAEGDTLVPVAIKVVHPGVFSLVKRDLQILKTVSNIIEFLFPSVRWLSVSECCEEFASLLSRQVDLRYEATCLEHFVENFKEDPNVRFPRPIHPFCKRDVLVETFEEGEPISHFLQENAVLPVGLKELLASYGVQALLQMVFVDNFVHGDLHPGNILVQNADNYMPQDENKLVLVDICDTIVVNVKPAENPVRLVLIDAGISASLSDHDMHNFKAVFTAVVLGEGQKVAELMLKHARYNECKDIGAFKEELGHLVNTTRKQTVTLGKVHVAELLSNVFSIMSRHRVKLESNFVSILLAIFVLEGLGRSLDPDMNILAKARPILLAS